MTTTLEHIIAIDLIDTNRLNAPDRFAGDDDDEALVENIRIHGQLQPVVVRPMSNGRFQLVAGERRLRALRQLGSATIKVVPADTATDDDFEVILSENLGRKNYTPWRLLTLFGRAMEQARQTDAAANPGEVGQRVAIGARKGRDLWMLLGRLDEATVTAVSADPVLVQGLTQEDIRRLTEITRFDRPGLIEAMRRRLMGTQEPAARPVDRQRVAIRESGRVTAKFQVKTDPGIPDTNVFDPAIFLELRLHPAASDLTNPEVRQAVLTRVQALLARLLRRVETGVDDEVVLVPTAVMNDLKEAGDDLADAGDLDVEAASLEGMIENGVGSTEPRSGR